MVYQLRCSEVGVWVIQLSVLVARLKCPVWDTVANVLAVRPKCLAYRMVISALVAKLVIASTDDLDTFS